MILMFYTAVVWTPVLFLAGRRFFRLWKGGIAGVAIAFLVDCFGTKYNFYAYPGWGLYLGGLPLLHLINVYALSILFLNWLPRRWDRRLLYTIYASALLLAVEAMIHSAGAIVYPNWRLWYSYFVIAGGLFLLAFLTDLFEKLLPPREHT
ncbi:MAG: hypothetical protein K6T66_00970 [Peptococcaceae bacterium]|nr:hypothetical protein [Peptococcaceae bacterium]